MSYGMYRGKPENEPGKMMYRHKGSFDSKEEAQRAQKHLAADGKQAKVVKYTGDRFPPYSLYVMAKHDFWGKSFILKRKG